MNPAQPFSVISLRSDFAAVVCRSLPAFSFGVVVSVLAATSCAEEVHPAAVEEPHSYIDDDDQRPLAHLEFDVDDQHPKSLKLTISAVGPAVEPIAGFRGIQGANRYTAEELGLLLSGKHPVEVVTTTSHGERITGRLDAGAFGRLPERRLSADGRILFLSETDFLYPRNVLVRAGASEPGIHTTVVRVSGRPRLRVRYRIHDNRVHVLELQSLGGDHLAAHAPQDRGRQTPYRLTVQQKNPEPSKSIIDWAERDLEGRWVAIQKDIAEHPIHIADWVQELGQREEFELLEWLAIAQPDVYKSYGAGELLQAKGAPQWIRVTVWNLGQSHNFGHGATQANRLLLHRQPGIVEDWLKQHYQFPEPKPAAGEDGPTTAPEMSGPGTSLPRIYTTLRNDEHPAEDSSAFSPPLDIEDVFRLLDAPQKLSDFGDRKTAEAEVVYLHQVLRAINAVVVSGQYVGEVLNRLNRLLKHPHPRVRQEVCLAYTHIVGGLRDASLVPDFTPFFENDDETDAVREAALMAYSYRASRNPLVELTLLKIAEDASHPAWSAAVSRLGELLPAAGMSLLDEVPRDPLSVQQKKLLAAVERSIQQRKTTTRHYHHATARAAVVSLGRVDKRDWKAIARSYAKAVEKGNVAGVRPYEFKGLQPNFESYADRFREIHQEIIK